MLFLSRHMAALDEDQNPDETRMREALIAFICRKGLLRSRQWL